MQSVTKGSTYNVYTPDSGTWDYTLDEAGRMTRAVQTGAPGGAGANTTFNYRYDAGGNRTSIQTNTATPTTTVYDAAGLPTTETTGSTTVTYQHDAVGNLVKKSTGSTTNYTYSFDAWNRQTKAIVGANTMTYTVDPLGRAIKRAKGKTTTTYAFQGLSEQIAAATTGSSTTNYAYTASGSPLAQKTGTTTRFMLSNPHGDVVGMTDAPGANASGVIKGSVDYSPYGERRNPLGEATTAALGYQGQLTDADTKLVDTRTRMYDPSMGRFISMDTLFGEINAPMSLNQYVYGGLNPVTFSDPSGMCANPSICPPPWIQDGVDDPGDKKKIANGAGWDGTTNSTSNSGGVGGGPAAPTYTPPFVPKACTSCHFSPSASWTPGDSWMGSGSVDCQSCHAPNTGYGWAWTGAGWVWSAYEAIEEGTVRNFANFHPTANPALVARGTLGRIGGPLVGFGIDLAGERAKGRGWASAAGRAAFKTGMSTGGAALVGGAACTAGAATGPGNAAICPGGILVGNVLGSLTAEAMLYMYDATNRNGPGISPSQYPAGGLCGPSRVTYGQMPCG